MIGSSILILSNDKEIGKQIENKIKLLRSCDTVRIVSYIEAVSVLNSSQPSLILVYCANSDSIGIIKEIRAIHSLDKVPIIYVADNFVEDILLYAFDNGIDDFFFLTDSDSMILMRILLTIQKFVLYKQIEANNDILVNTNILEKRTGIYEKEHAPIILRNFFGKSMEENAEDTVFMYLKPVSIKNKKVNFPKISEKVKKILRADDIVAYGRGSGFYIILYNSGIEGSKSVIKRLKNSLNNICEIYGAAAQITTSYEQMEPVLYQSVQDQIEAGKEFNYIYEDNLNEAIEASAINDENGKPFKEFKQEFYKSFEKITAPVFYQQKANKEAKFPNAKIEYNVNENESKFTISQDEIISELTITYPSYIKLIMDIKHYEKDIPPMIRRQTYDFEDFSAELLNTIIDDIAGEFSNRITMNEMQNQINE